MKFSGEVKFKVDAGSAKLCIIALVRRQTSSHQSFFLFNKESTAPAVAIPSPFPIPTQPFYTHTHHGPTSLIFNQKLRVSVVILWYN